MCEAKTRSGTKVACCTVTIPGQNDRATMALSHPLPSELCLPTATELPIMGTGDFGTSPIFVQFSGKPLLASVFSSGLS
jgi:hypothetical protein